MKKLGTAVLTLLGVAFTVVAVVALEAALGPCTSNCGGFAENAKMYKGYAAVAGSMGVLSWTFAGLWNLQAVRNPPPHVPEERP